MKTPTWFDPDPTRDQIWSCGGGRQSQAIAVLIATGKLPRPNLCLMVDTERESGAVFPYFEKYTRPALESVGVEIAVVRKSEFATVDLTSKNGKSILLPGYTNQSGKIGKLPTYCSGEWKRDVAARYLRRERKVKAADVWIGFSFNEKNRLLNPRYAWQRNIYPLVHLRMGVDACEQVVTDYGWPPSPRSACWMCPNLDDVERREQKENRPDDFAMAVSMDRMLRKRDPHFFLHKSCKPLDEVDFTEQERDPVLFGCESGGCFV